MGKINVHGEAPFQVLAHSFSVSHAETSYTLEYSADGYDYTEWEESTPANETLFCVDIPKNAFFRLKGNTGDVVVTY